MSKFNAGKISLFALIAVSGLSLLMLFNSLTSVIAKQENNNDNHQNQNNDNHEENNNENNNHEDENNHEDNNNHENNSDDKKDVCPNIEGDQESLPSGYHFETIERVEKCIKDADPIIPDDGDICHNIDGVQYVIPEGMHMDAAGQNCVNFSPSGPAPRNDEGVGGAVLGTSTGKVLGASTMAGTGSFAEIFYQAIMGIGATISAFGIKGLKKGKKAN